MTRRIARRGLTTVAGIAAAGLVATATAPVAGAATADPTQQGRTRPRQPLPRRARPRRSQPKDKLGSARPRAPRHGAGQGHRPRHGHAGDAEGADGLGRQGPQGQRRLDQQGQRPLRLRQCERPHRQGGHDRQGCRRPRRGPQRVHPAPPPRGGVGRVPPRLPPWPRRVPAPRTTTRSCRPATSGRSRSRDAHPAWDGRGITIGVIDSGVDLDHPALQTTSTGERKIVDWVTGTHPLLEGDGSWRAMLTAVTGPTFAYQGCHLDRAGGQLQDQPRLGEHLGCNDEAAGDFNRDGDTDRPLGRPLQRDHPRHLGRREPGLHLLRQREDAALQGEVRHRPLRRRQPGDRHRRVDAVRRRVPRGRRPGPGAASPAPRTS